MGLDRVLHGPDAFLPFGRAPLARREALPERAYGGILLALLGEGQLVEEGVLRKILGRLELLHPCHFLRRLNRAGQGHAQRILGLRGLQRIGARYHPKVLLDEGVHLRADGRRTRWTLRNRAQQLVHRALRILAQANERGSREVAGQLLSQHRLGVLGQAHEQISLALPILGATAQGLGNSLGGLGGGEISAGGKLRLQLGNRGFNGQGGALHRLAAARRVNGNLAVQLLVASVAQNRLGALVQVLLGAPAPNHRAFQRVEGPHGGQHRTQVRVYALVGVRAEAAARLDGQGRGHHG